MQERQGVLISEIAKGLDGGQPVGGGGIRLIQNDSGPCLDHRRPDAVVALLRERFRQSRQGCGIAGPEYCAGGIQALAGFGTKKRQGSQRGIDRAADAIVDPDRFEGRGKRCFQRLARCNILEGAILVPDSDLAASDEQHVAAQGLDDELSLCVSTLRHAGDGCFRVRIAVGGELRHRVFIGTRPCRLWNVHSRRETTRASRALQRDVMQRPRSKEERRRQGPPSHRGHQAPHFLVTVL